MWLWRQAAGRGGCCRVARGAGCLLRALRPLGDSATTDSTTKQIIVQGSEHCGLRVRRARPCDTPRVLRFVRCHARAAWPHAPPPAPRDAVSLVLADYVARVLAQGDSLLAEQSEGRRGWLTVRGLALGGRVCPWDAPLLERCARCVRCPRARRSLHFAAHCLQAPRLHDKYHVHNILQVMMVVPAQSASPELVSLLARGAVQRAKDQGIPLVRVDVTNTQTAKVLEDLQFKKEWHMDYEVVPETLTEKEGGPDNPSNSDGSAGGPRHFVTVYTAPRDKPASENT